MDIEHLPLIQDLRIFEAAKVSAQHGRERIRDLKAEGKLDPLRTPTGRCLLSFDDAKKLMKAL